MSIMNDYPMNDSNDFEPRLNCSDMLRYLVYLSDPFHKEPDKRTLITTLYITVACVGALGNSMVIAAVLRNPQMRTPRNYFIINLAFSDILMCILTVPFTMVYVLNQFWDLGSTVCKIVASAQAVNIFVSTMSITAIGLDRYWVILFPTKAQQQRFVIAACFTAIWTISLLLAFPMFYATEAMPPPFPRDLAELISECGIILFVCSENWTGMVFDRGIYSLGSTIFQYVMPLITLTSVYARIIWRLENRMIHRQHNSSTIDRTNKNPLATNNRRLLEQRQRRMNLLLICVVAFFAVCWLPLNVVNALFSFEIIEYNQVVFAMCHAFGMTSACANPILYGVFNENFRHEFIAILTFLKIVPLCRYAAKKLTPDRFRRSSGGEDGKNEILSTTIGQRNEFDHEQIRATSSAPAPVSSRQSKKAPRATAKSQKSRVAKFMKFTNPNLNNFDTIGLPESNLTMTDDGMDQKLVTPTENGCCPTVFLSSSLEIEKKPANGHGAFVDDAIVYHRKKDSSPIDADDKSTTPGSLEMDNNAVISEEKIPLFSGKSTSSSGNMKSYVLNTVL